MKIAFIQTGGTIDKDYPKTQKGWAFEIGEPAFSRILANINPKLNYSAHQFMQKDSLEINQTDRSSLASLINGLKATHIIITHGTDTMIQTGLFLNERLPGKTIVITGAMKPEKFKDSDASFNLGAAIGAIQHISPGVYVAMHGIVKEAIKIKRDENTGQFF